MKAIIQSEIAKRAMLVDLSVAVWTGRRRDKAVEADTISDVGAEKDAGTWWTRVVPPAALRGVDAAAIAGRAVHWRWTLPWSNNGCRILPAAAYLQYTEEMRAVRSRYYMAVDEFLAHYPDMVANAAQRLGKLYHAEHYPTPDRLRQKFHWEVRVTPMPDVADFRVDLGDAETSTVRQQMKEQLQETMQAATRDLWARLHGAISKVVERLGGPDKIFRDSLIENVKDLCRLLPALNVTNDPDLERMRLDVEQRIASHQPDDLRADDAQRAKAAAAATDILNKINSVMGGEQ